MSSVTCNAAGLPPLARATGFQSAIDGFICHALGPVEDKGKAHVLALICPFTACCGSPSAPSWQAPRACKRRKASSVTRHGRHRTSPALHVTRKTRSRRLAVAPLHHGASHCTMEHHDATGVTTPRQTMKASPHRHKWMLSPGAPADPSDPWNSHAAPVSPRQNGQRVQAETNLSRTAISAPVVSRVTKLSAAKGNYTQPGQALMMLVPSEVWVTANFKETQLSLMRPGQPVDIRIDAYPGRVFAGHVDSIQAGSGAAFSLLPPENATGNYVKVVQRVPVKIIFNDAPDVFVGPGMSVVPSVKVR